MRTNQHQQPDLGKSAFGLLVMLLCMLSLAGCSRSFWRQHADKEVYTLIPEKMTDSRWGLPRIDITPDPVSRIFDPYPADKGPLPPDDPAASEYMRRVNGIRQSRSWHKFGTSLSIENPHWLSPYGLAPSKDGNSVVPADDGTVPPPAPAGASASIDGSSPDLIRGQTSPTLHAEGDGKYGLENVTLQQALELSYIHSRDYQTEIENLYLQALNLTFDRFRFNVRFLGIGGMEPTANTTFESIPRVQNSVTSNKRFGISKLLPAGGQMAMELANSTIWLFAGPNQTNTATTLSYSLVQPLLLGAGRKVVLEGLTQSERDTLYATRILARFRRTFFADIVANGQSGGFLGILQQIQIVGNQQNNIRQLRKQLELLKVVGSQKPETTSTELPAFPAGVEIPEALTDRLSYNDDQDVLQWRGEMTEQQEQLLFDLSSTTNDADFRVAINELIAILQAESIDLSVAQLETRLANAINALSQSQRRLLDSLDQFKIQLGLPPDFHLTLDDSLLEQFTLIDDRFFELEENIDEYVDVVSRVDEDDPDPVHLKSVAVGLRELQANLREYGLEKIDVDLRRVNDNMTYRLEHLQYEQDRETVRRNVVKDRRLYASLRKDDAEIERRLDELLRELDADNLTVEQRKLALGTLKRQRQRLLTVARSLQAIQAGARVELIRLRPFDLGQTAAVNEGLDNRLDLKNARAQVMDARRREEVAANQLEAILDIVAEGDVRTRSLAANRGENPFDFRGRRSSFRVGARFTAPLDQIAERNDYRIALIDYQRARRDYMALEDNIKFSIRQNWRQLHVSRKNFEITRQALRTAATQLDITIEESIAPPGARKSSGQQGLNLLNALNSLLAAQNDLIGIWVDYERSRINIYRDMGMMDVDPRGVWTDEFYQQSPPSSSSPPESDDTQEQLETSAVLGDDIDRGSIRAGRRIRTDARSIAVGDRRRIAGRGYVRRPAARFVLPKKIELVEDHHRRGSDVDDRRGRVFGDSLRDLRQTDRVRQSGN